MALTLLSSAMASQIRHTKKVRVSLPAMIALAASMPRRTPQDSPEQAGMQDKGSGEDAPRRPRGGPQRAGSPGCQQCAARFRVDCGASVAGRGGLGVTTGAGKCRGRPHPSVAAAVKVPKFAGLGTSRTNRRMPNTELRMSKAAIGERGHFLRDSAVRCSAVLRFPRKKTQEEGHFQTG